MREADTQGNGCTSACKAIVGRALERDMRVHGEDEVWWAGLGRLPRGRDEGVRLTNWREMRMDGERSL